MFTSIYSQFKCGRHWIVPSIWSLKKYFSWICSRAISLIVKLMVNKLIKYHLMNVLVVSVSQLFIFFVVCLDLFHLLFYTFFCSCVRSSVYTSFRAHAPVVGLCVVLLLSINFLKHPKYNNRHYFNYRSIFIGWTAKNDKQFDSMSSLFSPKRVFRFSVLFVWFGFFSSRYALLMYSIPFGHSTDRITRNSPV